MISADAYSASCDLILDPIYSPEVAFPAEPVRRIFVTNEKQTFSCNVKLIREVPTKPELVYARTDHQFTRQFFWSVKPYVSHIYAVNCEFEHPMITHIPLGFYIPEVLPKRPEGTHKKHLCYTNFDYSDSQWPAHNPYKGARLDCIRYFDFPWVKTERELSNRTYFKRLAECEFVVCPFGFGLDSYRVYEAAWCGARPIVLSSGLDSIHKQFGAVIVNDWSEVTEPFLLDIAKQGPLQVDPKLFLAETWIRSCHLDEQTTDAGALHQHEQVGAGSARESGKGEQFRETSTPSFPPQIRT